MGYSHSLRRFLLVIPLLLLALLFLGGGARHVYFDLAYTSVDTELSFWGREDYTPTQRTIERTGATLDLLLGHRPEHADYLARQAYWLSWQGFFTTDISQRLEFNRQATQRQHLALRARPAYRQGWIEMIEYASRTSGGAPLLAQAQYRFDALLPPTL
ncbi:MAG: hypothetical protein V7720_12255 [Halioglobus sp.]